MYCGRSVNNLYGAGRLFACRHCYQLAYASQREPAHLWRWACTSIEATHSLSLAQAHEKHPGN